MDDIYLILSTDQRAWGSNIPVYGNLFNGLAVVGQALVSFVCAQYPQLCLDRLC